MKIICPECFAEYEVENSLIGRRVECVCGKKWNVHPPSQCPNLKSLFNFKINQQYTPTPYSVRIPAGSAFYGIEFCDIKTKDSKIKQIAGEINVKGKQAALLLTKKILMAVGRKCNLSTHDFTESCSSPENPVKYSYEFREKQFLYLEVSCFSVGKKSFYVQVLLKDGYFDPDKDADPPIYDPELLLPKSNDYDKELLHKKSRGGKSGGIIEKYPQFSGVCFGTDCPTKRQFAYALALGVDVNGKTFTSISTAIDIAKNRNRTPVEVDEDDIEALYDYLCDNSPADNDLLKEIKDFHASIPRKITKGEAEEILEFLEKHHIQCPFCGKRLNSIEFGLPSCPYCGNSFDNLVIPLKFD